jgi:hypothetical protein
MRINFYNISNCVFCEKAKELLSPQITDGTIVVRGFVDELENL